MNHNWYYIVVTHNDKEHQHCHVISSFIDLDGQVVDRGWIGLRAKKTSQKLTQKYNLTPAIGKDLSKTNLAALNKKEKVKYELYAIVSNILSVSKDYPHFKYLLDSKSVNVQEKLKRGTTEIQGISFEYKDIKFKASSVDRKFSYNRIVQHFAHAQNRQEYSIKKQDAEDTTTHKNTNPLTILPLEDFNASKDWEYEYDLEQKKKKRRNKRKRI